MEDKATEKKISEKRAKIQKWLNNNSNLILLGVFLVALVIRLYFFFLTKNQPLWWDEAEYMLKAKNIAFGTPDTGWWDGRPILFPFIAALFLKIGLGEIGIRFIWALLSLANIFLIYKIGEGIFSKKTGLIAAALYTFFYLDLFYAFRMLVDLPQIFFILLTAYFFVYGYILRKNEKYLYFIIPTIVIGILLRFTVGVFLITLILFLLITDKFGFLKNKKLWLSILIGFLVYLPYWIWSYIKFKSLNPFYVIFYTLGTTVINREASPFNVFLTYVNYFPNYLGALLTIIFVITLFGIFGTTILAFDLITKDSAIKKRLLLILWFILPLIYFGFFVNHFEDRYLFMSLPAAFLILGFGLERIYEFLKKYNRILGLGVLLILVIFGCFTMYNYSNAIIKDKINSYADLRETGLWMKENLPENSRILTAAFTEITYYSSMPSYRHLDLENDTLKIANGTFDYVVVTNWERTPDWFLNYLENNSTGLNMIHYSTSKYRGNDFFAAVLDVA